MQWQSNMINFLTCLGIADPFLQLDDSLTAGHNNKNAHNQAEIGLIVGEIGGPT